MDHIFQKPDIEEICTAAKKAITDTKDCIADIKQTAAAISAAAGSVPEEAKTGDLAGTAGSLPGKLEKDNYDVAKQKLTACHEKACSVIPAYDSRYAEEMQEITAATRKIKKVIEELQEFMLETPLTTPKKDFAALLKAKVYPPWEPPVSRFRATRKWYFLPSEPPQHIVAAHIFDFTINLLIVILGELLMQYHQIIYREVFLCLRRQKSEVFWNFWEKI